MEKEPSPWLYILFLIMKMESEVEHQSSVLKELLKYAVNSTMARPLGRQFFYWFLWFLD